VDNKQMTITTTKEVFKDRVNLLNKTIHERPPPKNNNDFIKYMIHTANIGVLKEFADRNFEGEKPDWIAFNSYYDQQNPNNDTKEDRFYLPHNEPKNHQVMFDTLKSDEIIPDDSKIEDYEFLFSFKDKSDA
jgi:hypothetical protein